MLNHTIHLDGKVHRETILIIRSEIERYEIGKFQREFLQTISIIEDRNGCITILATNLPPKYIIKKEQYIIFFKKIGNCFIDAG